MKKVLKISGWTLLGALVLLTFFFLWRQSRPVSASYELLEPSVRTISRSCVATGQIQPRRMVNVKPGMTGILSSIDVTVGQDVKAGDVIARVSVIPDMNSYNEALGEVEAASLSLKEAKREFERTESLYKSGVVPRNDYEKASHALSLAQEQAARAQSSLDIILHGSSSRSGSVNTTIVRAKMNGRVIDLPLKQGASVVSTSPYSEGTTIATIADVGDMIFEGKIDETEVDLLSVGQSVLIAVGSDLQRHVSGTLEEIASMGVKENGTVQFSLKASVDSDDGAKPLRAGYSANAHIITDEAQGVLSVEESAISFEDGQPCVYRLVSGDRQPQKFEKVLVRLGLSDGIYVELKDGVTSGMLLRGNKMN